MEAKTKKNQGMVNRCIKALKRYNELNSLRDIAINDYNEKEIKKCDKMCEMAYDRYCTYLFQLPKYEQIKIEKLLN